MNSRKPTLTFKQRQFVKNYIGRDPQLHGNATRSYKAAYGMTDTRSSQVSGSRLLHHPLIRPLLDAATKRQNDKLIVDSTFVLDQSKRLYDRAMGDEAIPGETTVSVDPVTGDEIIQTTERREYDPQTARQALQMIGQHKAVQAFSVTVEHSHTHHLEQRLAARSKLIEGKANLIEADPILSLPGQPVDVPGHGTEAPVGRTVKKVPSSGGQTESNAPAEETAHEAAGATAI